MSGLLDKTGATSGGIGAAVDERTYADHARPLLWRLVMTREFVVIALLLAVFVWARAGVPNFDGPLTLYYLFLDAAPIMLIALPVTLVIITGEIDLSVASTMGLTSVMLGVSSVEWGLPFELAIIVALGVGVACGVLNGVLVAHLGLPSLAVTIGTLALYRGLAEGLIGTDPITDFPEGYRDLATRRLIEDSPGSWPVILVPFAVLLAGFVLLLHFTPFGRGVYEIGLNDEAARFTGVDVARTKLILFVLAGAVSGFAGIYYALRFGSARGDNAQYLELQVVAAVLLGGVSIFGGRGSLPGVVGGVLLIAVITSALRLDGVRTEVVNIIVGTLLVASVIAPRLAALASRLLRRPRGRSRGPSTA